MKKKPTAGLLASCALAAMTLTGTAIAQAPASGASPPAHPQPALVPRPTLAEAQKALDAAVANAKGAGIALGCAVVDVRGDLVALVRMDDANFTVAVIAQGKAMSSAIFGRPSADLQRMGTLPFFTGLNASMQNRMIPMQGAVPILRNDRVIGAIGCSGGAPQQDEAAAKAGLATLR